eukprot:6192721-Pleurochrysis_carterae.AAC.2
MFLTDLKAAVPGLLLRLASCLRAHVQKICRDLPMESLLRALLRKARLYLCRQHTAIRSTGRSAAYRNARIIGRWQRHWRKRATGWAAGESRH